jgi:two-component system sensor histidine kinase KdpD
LWKIALIFLLSSLLSFAFESFAFGYENILLLFIIAVVLVIMESRSYLAGFLSAIVFVLFFNFFFTEPRYTFLIEESRYIITLLIFLVVSFLIGSLMQKLRVEATRAMEGERKTEALYNVAKELLSIATTDRIHTLFQDIIRQNTGIESYLYVDGQVVSDQDSSIPFSRYDQHIEFAVKTGSHIGIGTMYRTDIPFRIIGIGGITGHRIALLLVTERTIQPDELDFINAIINLYKIVMQREIAKQDEENSRVVVQNERFKNQILRGISHDLRTPLTSILTGTTLLHQATDMDPSMRNNILSDIMDEVESMSLLLDNILQMTKFQNQEVVLRKTKQSVDDLVSMAATNVRRRLENHTLTIEGGDEVILVNVDEKLMVQVLMNLIDNAIQHTHDHAAITISYHASAQSLHLAVADNGGGIPAKDLKRIFASDYTGGDNRSKRRGFGIGLNICQAIIEQHGGSIQARNNDLGGATFDIVLPL